MTRLQCFLAPLSPHLSLKKKKKNVKVGPPLTKLYASGHDVPLPFMGVGDVMSIFKDR